MEKHVVSLSIADQLKKAGWKKTTEYYWYKNKLRSEDEDWGYDFRNKTLLPLKSNAYYAPLATELLEELPTFLNPVYPNLRGHSLYIHKNTEGYWVSFSNSEGSKAYTEIQDKSLPNALALIWLYLKRIIYWRMEKMIYPCGCKDYNGGQCYHCLNGVHDLCDAKNGCKTKVTGIGLRIKAIKHKPNHH